MERVQNKIHSIFLGQTSQLVRLRLRGRCGTWCRTRRRCRSWRRRLRGRRRRSGSSSSPSGHGGASAGASPSTTARRSASSSTRRRPKQHIRWHARSQQKPHTPTTMSPSSLRGATKRKKKRRLLHARRTMQFAAMIGTVHDWPDLPVMNSAAASGWPGKIQSSGFHTTVIVKKFRDSIQQQPQEKGREKKDAFCPHFFFCMYHMAPEFLWWWWWWQNSHCYCCGTSIIQLSHEEGHESQSSSESLNTMWPEKLEFW